MSSKPKNGPGGLPTRPRRRPTRKALFSFKKFWRNLTATELERRGLPSQSELSVPSYLKRPTKRSLILPSKDVAALTRVRGQKRKELITTLRAKAVRIEEWLAPVPAQISAADKIIEHLPIVQADGTWVNAPFRGVHVRNEIKALFEARYAARGGNFGPMHQFKTEYGKNPVVTDIHGKRYTLTTNVHAWQVSKGRMTDRQRAALQERYAEVFGD